MNSKEKAKFSRKWHNIKWKQVSLFVADVQKRIALAKRSDDLRGMYKLQNELLKSFEGRAMAVRHVTTINRGKNTPGIDNVIYTKAYEKYKAISDLKATLDNIKKYRAKPVKRKYIPKPHSEDLRPLGIPVIYDRCLQGLYKLILDPVVEETSDETSYGYRKGRSAADAINRIFHILRQSGKRTRWSYWVWDADIEKCFDEICHKFLLGKLKDGFVESIVPFKQWLEAGIIDKGVLIKSNKGVPQGGVISPLLCNLALNGMLDLVRPHRHRPNTSANIKQIGRHLVRYADDFILTARTKEEVKELIPIIKEFLDIRGLKISEKKSKIVHINEGFEFLSWDIKNRPFRYNKNKRSASGFQTDKVLVIKPTKNSIKKIRANIRKVLLKTRRLPFGATIKELNPVLRGWCNYYRHQEQGQIAIQSIGHYVTKTVIRFLRKKHPTRSLKWLLARFRHSSKTRTWIFSTKEGARLQDCSELTTKRHYKQLEGKKNPYVDREYFQERKSIMYLDGLYEKVLKRYKGCCGLCEEKFENDDVIEMHHIKPQKSGGENRVNNLMPLHETCHHSITYGRLRKSQKFHK